MAGKSIRAALLAASLIASMTVSAQAQTSVADIDRIQSDALLIKAQTERAKAQKELAELQGISPADAGGGLPVVRGIFGANGKRYVSFLYPTGGVAEAQAGGTIPGDYTVRSFDATGVVLSKGKRTYRIPFSMQAPTLPPSQPMGANPYSPISGGPITTVPPMR